MTHIRVGICVLALCFPGLVVAQVSADAEIALEAETQLNMILPELPDPGLTPNSPFFIFEQLLETIGDTFIFDPDAKAKRQGERAIERIAEIEAMLAEKGVRSRGLSVALKQIEKHASKAATLAQESNAKDLGRDLESQKVLLKKIIDEKKRRLREEHKERKDALHRQLVEKILTRADDEAGDLESELSDASAKADVFEALLDNAVDATVETLDEQEQTIEQVLGEDDRQHQEFKRDVRANMNAHKHALKEHLKELRSSLMDKEHALKEQLREAVALGDDDMIERLTEEFSVTMQADTGIDAQIRLSDALVSGGEATVEALLLEDAEVNIDSLMKRERTFLDQVSKGADLVFSAKRKAQELRLDAQKDALNLKGKRLGHEIVKRRQECLDMDVPNLGLCVAERARNLQQELEEVVWVEKIIEEEQKNLSDESNEEEGRFDESVVMRLRALDTLRTLEKVPDRLLEEAQKLSERARETQQQWREKMDILKEERRTNEENIRQRMQEGKEAIRIEWQEFLKTDFDPEELKTMQEERRMEQKELLEGAKEERGGIREEFKEDMREVKEEREIIKEKINEDQGMIKDDAEAQRSEKQRMKEEDMRMFLEKRDELFKQQQKESDQKMEERRMMDEKKPEQGRPTPLEKSYLPQKNDELLKEQQKEMEEKKRDADRMREDADRLLRENQKGKGTDVFIPERPDWFKEFDTPEKPPPRPPSRDTPDRRPEEPKNEKPVPPLRPTYENPLPPKRPTDSLPPQRDDGRSGEAKGNMKSEGEDPRSGIQLEFEGKGGTNSDR